jgi:short-subunit dehydrogenase
VCIYCAGIGAPVHLDNLAPDITVFGVNLMGAVVTAAAVIPAMVNAGAGHFIVLSSQADELLSPQAPSYATSKAGLSSYFESLALALQDTGVAVTNIRFGFVDTKMANAELRPFLISSDKAAAIVLGALRTRPIRITFPLRMALLVWILRFISKWRVRWFSLRRPPSKA